MFVHKNPRKQGEAGLGAAIAHFTASGFTVLVPLGESQPYDLVVDIGGLKKVQVKTTRVIDRDGNYAVALKTMGGNRSGQTVKYFDPANSDLLFILCGDGSRYLIPTIGLRPRSGLHLGPTYATYKIAGP